MPSRNIVKVYDSNAYYHVYNRGVEKRKIFLDDQDYAVFVSLLKRYLSDKQALDSRGREYLSLAGKVEVVAFCLMPNHFHILLYQIELGAATQLLRAVCSSYVTYFNSKYNRVGALFQGNFKAVRVNSDNYLSYLTRYIHCNPDNYLNYEWSSLDYWLGNRTASWLNDRALNDMSPKEYMAFIKDEEKLDSTMENMSEILFDY